MHVLATQLATLEEADVAVDLGQSPAEVVVLSFSDSDLSALAAAWQRNDSLVCIGLDPEPEKLPAPIFEFNKPLAASITSRTLSASRRSRFWCARNLLFGSTSARSGRAFDDWR